MAQAKTTAPARRWADPNDVAAYLGVCRRTVFKMAEDGRIKPYKLGAKILRFDLNEVDAALEGSAAR